MIRRINQIAGGLVCLFGLLHLAVGHAAFTSPTEARIWFASAGFLLLTTGLANIAAGAADSRLQSAAAASGSIAILIIGALLARGKPELLIEPQTILLLTLGVMLSSFRLGEIFSLTRIGRRGVGA